MTQEELYRAAHHQPFTAFRITLTTGATYDIHHPDLIMVGNSSATIGITHQPNKTVYDYTIKVDLFHIVSIEELPVSSPSSSNGPTA